MKTDHYHRPVFRVGCSRVRAASLTHKYRVPKIEKKLLAVVTTIIRRLQKHTYIIIYYFIIFRSRSYIRIKPKHTNNI